MTPRFYTVMIVPDARARFRRYHLSRRTVVVAAVALSLVGLLALSSPLLAWKVVSHASRSETLARDNQELRQQAAAFEESLTGLRERLAGFERQTTRLAWMAGDMDAGDQVAGAGSGEPAGLGGNAERSAALRAELEVLNERSNALGQRLERVSQIFTTQADRLASIPSILPVQGLIGHGFGWRRDPFTGQRRFHQGLDISAPDGTPVRAPADGVVIKARRYGGYGNVIYLSHGNGLVSRYGHLREYKVKPGQRVQRGQMIATVGNSGRSTAPHLHYEILLHNRRIDPLKYVINSGLTP